MLFRRSYAWSVYDWSGWKGTLGERVTPQAGRLPAKIGESPQRVARRLPAGVKYLLVHLDISDNAPFIASPAEFTRALEHHGVAVLNCKPSDIRKRTVQACCEAYGLPSLAGRRAGDPDESLIVKTDLNSGGTREQLLSPKHRQRFNLPAELSRLKGPKGYYVSRRRDLDPDLWHDPDLVIERYVTNSLGRFYRVYVAGNAIVISAAYDGATVKRMGGDIRRHNHLLWRRQAALEAHVGGEHDLPPGLLHTAGTFIQRFELDYGALDIVESDAGEFFVVDVNKTPYWGDERQPGMLEHLRLGFSTAPSTSTFAA